MKPFPAGNMMSFCFLPLFLQEASQKDKSGTSGADSLHADLNCNGSVTAAVTDNSFRGKIRGRECKIGII